MLGQKDSMMLAANLSATSGQGIPTNFQSEQITICGIGILVLSFHNVSMTHLHSVTFEGSPVFERKLIGSQHNIDLQREFADGGTILTEKTRWFNSSLHYVVGV